MTQAELVGPDGVGLLVYGSGLHWGTAYLGPDGHAPDSAGTLVAVPGAAAGPPPDPELALDPEAALDPGPELTQGRNWWTSQQARAFGMSRSRQRTR